jgi:glycine/serine hydroxymethyltransferase
MAKIANWMKQAIDARKDEKTLNKLSDEVKQFALQFPLPSDN